MPRVIVNTRQGVGTLWLFYFILFQQQVQNPPTESLIDMQWGSFLQVGDIEVGDNEVVASSLCEAGWGR
jgi:hypothetical protein